jgi:hypothetical protein
MAQVIKGTPDELARYVGNLPNTTTYRITVVPETATSEPDEEEVARADAKIETTIVSLGYATGTSNESIDADLARAYGDDHAACSNKSGIR